MQENDKIVEYVIMTSLGLALLTSILLFLTYIFQKRMHKSAIEMLDLKTENQKALFAAVSNTEQLERERIASNLHDDVGMSLNLVKQNLSRQRRQITPNTEAYQLTLDSIELLNQSIDKISSSVYELVPKFMLEFGLLTSLRHDIELLHRSGAIRADFFVDSDFEFETLFDKRVILEINRICTELLNNLIKHSECSELSLTITKNLSHVTLLYQHNGIALTNDQVDALTEKSQGLGMKSIKGRSILINANIKYYSEDEIAVIKFEIPL